jgi:hypothetical protein
VGATTFDLLQQKSAANYNSDEEDVPTVLPIKSSKSLMPTANIKKEVKPYEAQKPNQVFVMPKFMISVASPVFPNMKFLYKNKEYSQDRKPTFDFPSLHMYGATDEYKDHMNIHKLFKPNSGCEIVEFEEGHKFPRSLPGDGFLKLKEFVKQRFIEKNGIDSGFEVDYENYNFAVKFEC